MCLGCCTTTFASSTNHSQTALILLHAATAMARTAEPMVAPDGAKVVCHPAQANWGWPGHAGCPVGDEIMSPKFQPYPNHTYHYPTIDVFGMGFTMPGVLFSGIASPQVVRELVDWAKHQGGVLTVNVPHKPGTMGGVCSFVELGHGYGLILNDMIDEYHLRDNIIIRTGILN
jgi:hypothetical protein|eukprot:COSAG01_NODE_3681_length_5802_cov_4.141855_3_plen_173_part_00